MRFGISDSHHFAPMADIYRVNAVARRVTRTAKAVEKKRKYVKLTLSRLRTPNFNNERIRGKRDVHIFQLQQIFY